MDTDIKITINLNKMVEERIKKMSGYRDFAGKAITGELISSDEIDELAVKKLEDISKKNIGKYL